MKKITSKLIEKKRLLQTTRTGVAKTKGIEKATGGVGASGPRKKKAVSSALSTFLSIVTGAFKKRGTTNPCIRDLLAMLGLDGHSVTSLASDFTVRRLIADHLISEIADGIAKGAKAHSFFKIAIEDDKGVSSLAAPIIRFKALDDGVSKVLREAAVGAYRAPCLRVAHSGDAGSNRMVLSTRLVAMAKLGTTAQEMQASLRSTNAATAIQGCQITATAIEADCIGDAVVWLLSVPGKTIRRCRAKDGSQRWKSHGALADHEAMLVFEALSGLPSPNVLAGSDTETRALVGRVKGNVSNAQRGRVRKGRVLEQDFDVWQAMYRMHQIFEMTSVGVRTDLPLKKAPKVRTSSEIKKEMEAKGKRLRKSKPVPPPADTIEQ